MRERQGTEPHEDRDGGEWSEVHRPLTRRPFGGFHLWGVPRRQRQEHQSFRGPVSSPHPSSDPQTDKCVQRGEHPTIRASELTLRRRRGEVDAEVGLGMDPELALEPGQVRRNRQPLPVRNNW